MQAHISPKCEDVAIQGGATCVPIAAHSAVINAVFSANSASVQAFGGVKLREFRVGESAPLPRLKVAWEA
jgi:hypothetical protein